MAALRLPLRSKVEFSRALDASNINAALRTALAAVDDERRAGEPAHEDTVGAWPRGRTRACGAQPADALWLRVFSCVAQHS
jgi:hypothetical protein